MLEDLQKGLALTPTDSDARHIESLVRERQPHVFTFADWLRLDQIELANGHAQSRPRCKFTSVNEMVAALGD
jgi:ferredoxin--NADP+ reductase